VQFKELTIQGFKSFHKKKTFVFPEKAGFYFVTGRNEVEPELEANGTGKTSMFDALVWCLYGKTCRGLRASDIGPWNSKEKCVVTLTIAQNEGIYTILRSWSPNSLKLRKDNGEFKTITQEDVEKLVKLDFDSFLYGILFSQFKDMFFDLDAAKKSELFSSILNLSEWEGYSKKAKTRVAELEGFYHDTKEYISELKGRYDTLKELDFTEKLQNWEESRDFDLKGLEIEQKELQTSLNRLKIDGKQLISSKEKPLKIIKNYTVSLEECEEVSVEVNDLYRDLIADEASCDTLVDTLDKEIQKLESVEGECPYCLQAVSKDHLDAEIKILVDRMHIQEEKLDYYAKELKNLSLETQELKKLKFEYNSEMREADKELHIIERKLISIKADSNNAMRDLQKARLAIIALEKEQNPYKEEERQNLESVKEISVQIKQQSKDLIVSEKKTNSVRYWIKGFKEIRLFLISEVLTQLELEVNNCLYQLGLRDWKIEFAVDTENKSGTIKKGFTVLIYSPYNTKPVNWKSWSGGESQRLRLAGTLGLSNLILNRNGVESSLEIFDEPTTGLSEKGIQDLLETLDSRSRLQEKQLFVIDHRSLEYGGFDKIFTVAKDEKGSRFEESNEVTA